jgi:hypothetical protein
MLFGEIEPFAQAHIKQIRTIQEQMSINLESPTHSETVEINRDTLKEWIRKLSDTAAGYVRFQVCMTGEQTSKHKYAEKALYCRMNHKD